MLGGFTVRVSDAFERKRSLVGGQYARYGVVAGSTASAATTEIGIFILHEPKTC